MKFRMEEIYNVPYAYFDDEKPPRSYILSAFLEEAFSFRVQTYLDMIELGQCSKNASNVKVTGLTGNSTDVDIYPDHLVIESLYPVDEAKPERTEMTLEEAKQLLLEWKDTLTQWYAERDAKKPTPKS